MSEKRLQLSILADKYIIKFCIFRLKYNHKNARAGFNMLVQLLDVTGMTLAQLLFLALVTVGTVGLPLLAIWYDRKHGIE